MPEAIRRIDRPIISRDPHNNDVEYGPAGAMLHIADIIEVQTHPEQALKTTVQGMEKSELSLPTRCYSLTQIDSIRQACGHSSQSLSG